MKPIPRYFIDTNVLLDGVFYRPPLGGEAADLLEHGAYRRVRLVTTAMSLAVLLGKLQKKKSSQKPGPLLNKVRSIMTATIDCFTDIAPVSKGNFLSSINSGFHDVEDGTLYHAAIASGPIMGVVTNNKDDFDGRVGNIPIYTAKEALDKVNAYWRTPPKPTRRRQRKR